MLPAADQLKGDFIFQQDLAPAHSAKATSTWFKDHGIPVLNWPANSPDLKTIENLWGIVKRKMEGMGFSLVVSYNHKNVKKETFEYISLCVMNVYNIHFSLFEWN